MFFQPVFRSNRIRSIVRYKHGDSRIPKVPLLSYSCIYLLDVIVVKTVSALRTELRRIRLIFRFPTALVTLVYRNTGRLLCSAFRTEFTEVTGTNIRHAALSCVAVCQRSTLKTPSFPKASAKVQPFSETARDNGTFFHKNEDLK